MSNNKQNFKIVYSCNDAMFEPVYLSILSIVKRTKSNISFYLLTADLSSINPLYKPFTEKHQNIIDKMVKIFNKNNRFVVIDTTKSVQKFYNETVKKDHYASPYVLLRTLLFDFKVFNDGKVLY